MRTTVIRVFRAAALAAAIASIIAQWAVAAGLWPAGAAVSSDLPRAAADFFSYFTIQTNCLIAFWFAFGLLAGPRASDGLRAAVAVYGTITMVVFWTLLSSRYQPTEPVAFAANLGLHLILPLALVADMAIARPAGRLKRRFIGLALLFPLAYSGYTLVRGAALGWYPYFFVDPQAMGGYPAVALAIAGMTAAFAAVAAGARLLSNRLAPRTRP